MATKTKKQRGEKSQAVRAYLKSNPDAPVTDVVAELKKKGITISPAIVYNIRSTAKKSATKRGRKPKTAETNGAAEHGGKSQAVRAALKELGRTTPAKEVVDHLAAKGIQVSLPLVAQIKSKIKARRTARRGQTASPVSAAKAPQFSYDALLATKQLADQLGGTESLRKNLDLLEKLR